MDGIEDWNSHYSQVPRPGPEPAWLLLAVLAAATVLLICASVVLLAWPSLTARVSFWQPEYAVVIGSLAVVPGITGFVVYAQCHSRHTWMWGDAELVKLFWSDADEVDSVGMSILLAPISVMGAGLDLIFQHWAGRGSCVAERIVDGKVVYAKFRTGIASSVERQSYGWIMRACIWPRFWVNMESVIPGDRHAIQIPAEAVNKLANRVRETRNLNRSAPQPRKRTLPATIKKPDPRRRS